VTYFVGKYYTREVNGSSTVVKKYYTAGAKTIAMRTIEGSTNTLNWLLTDHLGSTSTTANEDGSWNSTIKYTAFGDTRETSGVTPTKYRYTGQLLEAEVGLYYYVARFYDPEIMHFVQADTIVPNATDSASYDRYAYVLNNPVKLSDPSGHACTEEGNCWLYKGDRVPLRTKQMTNYQLRYFPHPVSRSSTEAVIQSTGTSCGEASLTYAWNIVHPDQPVSEQKVIEEAEKEGLYTPGTPPFTSPGNLGRIGKLLADSSDNPPPLIGYVDINAGADEAFETIEYYLQLGIPVIVDVTVDIGNPKDGEAHFVAITGLDFQNRTVTYMDPFGYTGVENNPLDPGIKTKTMDEFWKSWSKNNDFEPGNPNTPTGNGWFMVVR
jgi:RHS repeat-associated protein